MRGDHVRWRSNRNVWVAARDKRTKTFKPDDINDQVSLQESHDKAARWAAGEDVGGDDQLLQGQDSGLTDETNADSNDNAFDEANLAGEDAVECASADGKDNSESIGTVGGA